MPNTDGNVGIPEIDALELARGALCVTSYEDANHAREVHISALLGYFNRAGLASTDALKTLWFLREAQSLDGGYWIPAPTRTVSLGGDLRMLVAIQPTEELRRHFPAVSRAGSARITSAGEVIGLQEQALERWRGADGKSASVWANSAVEQAMSTLSPSLSGDDLEVFEATPRARHLGGWEPKWGRAGGGGDACTWRGVGLFRARTGPATHRYFLGARRDGGNFLEGPAVYDVARMQFGLGGLQGRPFHPIVETARGVATVRLSIAAPTALRRLLVALCEEVPRSFGRVWTCRRPECMPMLTNVLLELSGEVEERE